MNLTTALTQLIDLKLLRQYLIYALAALIAALPLSLWFFFRGLDFDPAAVTELNPDRTAGEDDMHDRLNMLAVIRGSKLFSYTAPVIQVVENKITINDLIKEYRLKGVALTGEPEAIIQKASDQRMLFVKAGDRLGEMNLKAIEEGRVIVSYEGEERTLSIE